MEVEFVNPFILKPNPWNTNKMDRGNFEKLKRSLESLSCFKPILVRDYGGQFEILGGAHRVEAAKELGLPTVPVCNLGEISDEKAKEISLIDNTRYGKDDIELLDKLLEELDLEALSGIMPDEEVVLPEIETPSLDTDVKSFDEKDDDYKTLHFKCEKDKAQEIEAFLTAEAKRLDFCHSDGYPNLPEALYHVIRRYESEF